MLETTDAILVLDRFQNTDKARICQRDPKHGKLWVHKSGAHLVCTQDDCKYNEPVSKELLEVASEEN